MKKINHNELDLSLNLHNNNVNELKQERWETCISEKTSWVCIFSIGCRSISGTVVYSLQWLVQCCLKRSQSKVRHCFLTFRKSSRSKTKRSKCKVYDCIRKNMQYLVITIQVEFQVPLKWAGVLQNRQTDGPLRHAGKSQQESAQHGGFALEPTTKESMKPK